MLNQTGKEHHENEQSSYLMQKDKWFPFYPKIRKYTGISIIINSFIIVQEVLDREIKSEKKKKKCKQIGKEEV